MERHLPARDFLSLELSRGTATVLGGNQDYAPRNAHKRPWPFAAAADDRPHSLERPSSASVRQPAESLYLLGSIVDVKAQLWMSEYGVVSRPALFSPTSSSINLEVSLKGDYFELLNSGQAFARLNKSFCNEARRLADFGVEFRAYLQKNSWEASCVALNNSLPEPSETTFAVDVNVYSFRHHADRIGDIFSQAGFFLQHPIHDFANAPYYNPQVLKIEGFEERQETSVNFASESTWELVEPGTSMLSDRTELEHQRNGFNQLDSILNSLSHHGILHEIHTDQNRIRTTLLPHQMKAIDFIRQREDSDLSISLSLWKEQKLPGEETYFRHALTGASRPQRDEAKGGIIADDMGLGKTLVVLSAIAGSLNKAAEFVSNYAGDLSALSGVQHVTRATLILAPSTLLIDSWIDEIRTHTYSSAITFHKHLGPERGKDEEMKLNFEKDIVFTTFATVASELIRGNSPLAKIHWFRIVLDEAHEIRNRSTKQFQAVYGLTAQQRWCLTGTPIQNSLEDLGALISFLRIPILDKAPTFRKYIIAPTTLNSTNMYRNLQTLLQTVCLRRTKEILGLPEVVPEEKLLRFSDREQREYDELFGRSGNLVQMAASGHRTQVSATVLHCIHELRLFCNNGSRRTGRELAETDDELLSELQQHNLNNCANCSGPIFSIDQNGASYGGIFISSCKHLVCNSCLPQCYKRKGDCVLCSRGNVPKRPSYDGRPTLYCAGDGELLTRSPEEYPSKLQALLNDLRRESSSKCIVFSSWKKTLDLAAQLLDLFDMRYDVIHGGLSLNKRLKVLGDFKSPTGPRILLMTLGTGAVGLNLAVASRIYILEPQWNPFIEFQAMARAQRLGQTKQIVIIRYIMERTIEQSNVLSKQRKKAALAGDGFGKEKIYDSLQYFGIQPRIR